MAHITAELARPGMIVSAPVMDRKGRLLIPEGCELTERHVQALRTWGIPNLQIEGDAISDPPHMGIDPILLTKADGEVRRRIGNNDADHPLMKVLRDHAVRRHAEYLMTRDGGG